MSSFKKIPTIGLVGLGNQGKKHLNSILDLQSKGLIKLVGLCDTSINTIQFSRPTNAPFCLDYRDLYVKTKPEIVVIATPNYLHKQMSLDALSKNIHVIKEKPLATNYLDACEMILTSQEAGKFLITTQQRFFSPLFLKAKNIIPSLGKIVSFSYRFTLNDTRKSWRWDLEKAGGGSWLNMGWHAVSVIQWLIGDIDSIELTWKVNGKREWDYKTDHSSFARVIVENNIIGSMFLSCAYLKKEEILKIVFSDGVLYLSRDILSRDSLRIFKKSGEQKIYHYNLEENSVYTIQLRELLKRIRDNNYSAVSDLKTMAVVQAGMESAYSYSSMTKVKEIYDKDNNVFRSINTAYVNF